MVLKNKRIGSKPLPKSKFSNNACVNCISAYPFRTCPVSCLHICLIHDYRADFLNMKQFILIILQYFRTSSHKQKMTW